MRISSCECRRCRRERESVDRRSADRDSMTYCLIDELTGSNERWTVNANDVLSFARQVAVAMVIITHFANSRYTHGVAQMYTDFSKLRVY